MDRIVERDAVSRGDPLEGALSDVVRPGLSDSEFSALYELHYRDVYRYILALTRSATDAEDVCAETFERAYRRWTTGPTNDSGRALPWLLLTARRIATDRWRRVRHLARLLPSLRPPAATEGHAQAEFWLWFDALSDALSERQREVLLLRYQRDLSDADIGSVMDLSESGVRSLLARALASLREHPELLS